MLPSPKTAVTGVTAIPENMFGSNLPRPKTHQNPARMYAVRIKTNIGAPTRSECIFVIGVTIVTDISDFAFWAIWKSFTLIFRSQLIKVIFRIRFGHRKSPHTEVTNESLQKISSDVTPIKMMVPFSYQVSDRKKLLYVFRYSVYLAIYMFRSISRHLVFLF